MAKELCQSCSARLPKKVSFCPACSRPTPRATEAELLEWDLGQWRQHLDRSAASAGPTTATVTRRPVALAPNPDLVVIRRPAAPKSKRSRRSIPRMRLRLPSFARESEDRVIVLDSENPFAYTACTSCERDDWILRTGRNEDETFNYWCVRCSRSFKSDARLRHAMKPFVAAGSVIATIGVLSTVIG